MSVSFRILSLCFVLIATFVSSATANERCDLGRCFSGLNDAEKARVLAGETVLATRVDPSNGFEQLYGYKLIKGVTPELAVAVFTDFAAHVRELGVVRRANVIERAPGRVVVDYELKAGDLLGGLAKMAPSSEYVLSERIFFDSESGRYWVTWEIDAAKTARYYKGFSLTGHLGQPEYIHGYFVIEPLANSSDVVVSYANVAVLKNDKARKMAKDPNGMLARNAREAHRETLERFARWIESIGKESDSVKQGYLAKLAALSPACEKYLTGR